MKTPSPHKIITDRKRKKLITEVAVLRLRGFSYSEIIDALNRKKMYSMTDRKWTKYTMATFINRYIVRLAEEGGLK